VEDLEDEVAGLSTRSDKLKSELEVIEDLIKGKKNAIDEHKEAIKSSIQNNRKLYVTIENSL
jgi:predicted  nucleic acid-binding Zn-ribbon protein